MKKKIVGRVKTTRHRKTHRENGAMKKLLDLAGSWEDTRSVEEQVRAIHRSRKNRP